ncbi:MAG: hypothetical protein HRT52_19575 [Colwellia sp.]|nr:hypothetical protein [Colwellia sp.]
MRKLISSPVKMPLSEIENQIYQNSLKYITELSLNLMAVKVNYRPEDFVSWCIELTRLCRQDLNMDLVEEVQLPALKKLQIILENGCSVAQFKMARIAPWPIYLGFIEQQVEHHALVERFKLLDHMAKLREQPLTELIEEDVLAFAGKHTTKHDPAVFDFDVEWFASTKGAKVFHQLLQKNTADFDNALSFIPLTGEVTFAHYQEFVTAYQKIFTQCTTNKPQGEKAPLAAATRLLAMRRPDQFIALTNAKIDVFCQGLAIVKFDNFDFFSYWQEMILTLRSFVWWRQDEPQLKPELIADDEISSDIEQTSESLTVEESLVGECIAEEGIAEEGITEENVVEESAIENAIVEKPTSPDDFELKVWQNRAILVDLFLFADENTALNSNFIKMQNKAKNKALKPNQRSGSSSVGRVRTKESAEMLVDRALAADGIPEYVRGKRDTIVKEVKNGKSVDHVIGLMRAIFG